jgi:hypothetical protein
MFERFNSQSNVKKRIQQSQNHCIILSRRLKKQLAGCDITHKDFLKVSPDRVGLLPWKRETGLRLAYEACIILAPLIYGIKHSEKMRLKKTGKHLSTGLNPLTHHVLQLQKRLKQEDMA